MDDFPNNSINNKGPEPAPKRRVNKPVTTTVRKRKKPLGKKLAESFTAEDSGSVGQFVLLEVMLPAAKNMVSDAVSQGIERLLFGDAVPRGNSSVRRGNYTAYDKTSTPARSGVRNYAQARTMPHDTRKQSAFQEVIVDTRGEATEILDRLTDLVREYGNASVSDLYDLVGITGSFTDNKWGWTTMQGASVRHLGGGYLVDLRPPQPIEE